MAAKTRERDRKRGDGEREVRDNKRGEREKEKREISLEKVIEFTTCQRNVILDLHLPLFKKSKTKVD